MILVLSGLFVFIWATGFIVAGIVSTRADPLTFLSVRHGCSIVVFTFLSLAVRAAWPRDFRTWRDAMVAGMLLHGFYIGGVFWAVSEGLGAGMMGLITGLHPLFTALLAAWFGNAARVLRPGGAFYVWGGYANVANYPPALRDAGLYFSQAIIWVKEHPVLTRKDFMGNHEWCFYGWREGAAHRFFGPANVPDVWSVKKVSPNAMVHLTEKPVNPTFGFEPRPTAPSSRISPPAPVPAPGNGAIAVGWLWVSTFISRWMSSTVKPYSPVPGSGKKRPARCPRPSRCARSTSPR